MDKKKIQSMRTRIKKANSSLSCMGEMLLHMELDAMMQADRIELQQALLNSRAPLKYAYLDFLVGVMVTGGIPAGTITSVPAEDEFLNK